MAPSLLLLLVVITLLSLLFLAEHVMGSDPKCPPLPCGILGDIKFPFSTPENPDCGFFIVDDCNKPRQAKIQLGKDGPWFYITDIRQDDSIVLQNNPFGSENFRNLSCDSFQNLNLSNSSLYSFEIQPQPYIFKCPGTNYSLPKNFSLVCNKSNHSIIFYNQTTNGLPSSTPAGCSVIQHTVTRTSNKVIFHNIIIDFFVVRVNVTKACRYCHWQGGQCLSDSNRNFYCSGAKSGNGNKRLLPPILGGLGIGVSVLLIVALSIYITWLRRKGVYANSRYTSSDPSSTSELETASVYFGVPVFSYSELAEATNNFKKELGGGGFGRVYHGKLRDGREVAVKRLYEHNYRRVEQFINEIQILTGLRHKNLVLLYGCTSRHSQGLLLVYEFIPNGTVADHLHGDGANPCLLPWPIRMNIAIETASALAYLHASDIIHRDVKTHNILLDNNFCVKVADFGLSRLFPTDVTHVSTAPQGTPGYVDPEYHQFYQLTDKSDVYSFGVVLIELISSMPAVDVSRHRYEINLANLAINRIQKHAIDELVDPCLGFHSDEQVKRMATSVAELAFLCLQQNKELRPTMDVVLEELQRINSGECKPPENLEEENDNEKEESKSMLPPPPPPPSPPHCEEAALLKNIKLPPSPISVTENWDSNNTTPNVSK